MCVCVLIVTTHRLRPYPFSGVYLTKHGKVETWYLYIITKIC